MFLNYIKIALRNLFRNKLYSLINILGLAIGMAACLMIYLWVQNELSYDQFHQNAERIFRVERKFDFRDMHGQMPITSGPYGPALVRDYPEVEDYVRFYKDEAAIKDQNNIYRIQDLLSADNSIFSIFDFRLERGDPLTALEQPMSIVMTRENALKYLGTEDAIGKSLTLDWRGSLVDFQITGILEEVPQNSHVHFDAVISINSLPEEQLSIWFNNYLYTYVLLKRDSSPADLESKLSAFLTKYMAADFLAVVGPETDINEVFQLKMKPLLDIHLYPSAEFEIEAMGSMTSIYIFTAIAILILVIACINFMNLSTARANKRAREVGLRKTVGANRNNLRRQFLGESLVMAFLALSLAFLLIYLFIPVFNTISGKLLAFSLLFQLKNVFALVAITFITGLLAGMYPAFYLSAFEPAKVLKGGALYGTGKSVFRRSMAVVQFVISITMIIGTVIIFQQMEYIQNKSLGFDKENMIIIPADSNVIRQNIDAFRSTLTEYASIKSVAVSSDVPGNRAFSDTVFKRDDIDDVFNMIFINTDYDFVDTYGFKLLHGRNFSREFGADMQGAFILNEAAVREIGYTPEEAVGKKLLRYVEIDEMAEGRIIGVVDNFHYKSLHRIIQPLVLRLVPDDFDVISVRVMPGDIRGTLDTVQAAWTEVFPGEEFDFTFLDARFRRLYESEGRMRDIFLSFSVLSIFVACLGLFGLAAFTAEERTKEIGVRKVLGASVPNIFMLLSKEFTKWVMAANIVAWPVAYFMMSKWLENFAYRISLGLLPFVLSAVAALLIALFTVSYQSIKAALANPIDSLRYE